MKTYEFPIVLVGSGETPEEAWRAAVESFVNDPGDFDPDQTKAIGESK